MKNNKKATRDEVIAANAMTSVGTVVNNSVGQYLRPAVTLPAQTEEALAQIIPNSRKPEVTPPEPVEDTGIADDTPVVDDEPVTPVKTKPIVKSRKRTSLDEFAHRTRMRPEIKAGFRAWMRGQHFAFDNEWEQLFNDYNNRKI